MGWGGHHGSIISGMFGRSLAIEKSHLRVILDSFEGHLGREVISRDMSSGSHRGVIGGSSAGHWESWRDHFGVFSAGHRVVIYMGARLGSSGGHRGGHRSNLGMHVLAVEGRVARVLCLGVDHRFGALMCICICM